MPRAWVDEVYARADIVKVVSSYLPLSRKGRSHFGLCPFHSEKTPSFSVNPELNVYYCFGCKAGGNVVQFVMEMERLSYQEALLHLAKLFALPPPDEKDDPEAQRQRSQRERLYDANREAALYFHHRLYDEKETGALSYLRQRGLDDAIIRRFGLGASSAQWDGLAGHLGAKGFSTEELVLAGLVQDKGKARYDVFRSRVMFPIIDLYGRTVGFGARALGDSQPKYLNTADTQVFNKRLTVYGVNLLRKKRNLKRLILVEGYMDVLALDKSGVDGVVATLGTSLTPEQARLVKRFAPEVWISFDGDEPGQLAAQRAIEVFEREGVAARVLPYPEGIDPDELIRKGGAAAFYSLKPVSPTAFRLGRIEKAFDLSNQEGRTGYAREASVLLAGLNDPIETDLCLKALSVKTGFSIQTLKEQVSVSRGRNPAALTPPARPPQPRQREKAPVPENLAEKTLIALLASGHLPPGMVGEQDFTNPTYRDFAGRLLRGQRPVAILAELGDSPDRTVAGEAFAMHRDLGRDQVTAAAEGCLKTMRITSIMKQIGERTTEMDRLSEEQKEKALQEIMSLSAELRRLKGMAANGKDVV